MLPRPVALALAALLLLAAVFMGSLYEFVGLWVSGALAFLMVVLAFWVGADAGYDRRTKLLLILAALAFTGRRVWDGFGASGMLPNTADSPGPIEAFAPISHFQAVRDFVAPGAKLSSFEASRVRSDGTVDLRRCEGCVSYAFLSPRRYRPPDEPPSKREVTGKEDHLYEVALGYEVGRQLVWDPYEYLEELEGQPWPYSWASAGSMKRKRRGILDDMPAPLPEPTCLLSELWKGAIAAGQPAEGEATISYDAAGYHFRTLDEEVHLRFDRACALKGVVQLRYYNQLRGEAMLTLDGEPAGEIPFVYREGFVRELWLDPGEHTFTLTSKKSRWRPVQGSVTLEAGEEKTVELHRPTKGR